MNAIRMIDVVVIGGGVAGLVAARECAHIGLTVTIIEATDAVGGAVASHEVAGLTLDSGAESFAVRRGSVADFVAGLGLTEQIVAPNSAGAWLCLPADRRTKKSAARSGQADGHASATAPAGSGVLCVPLPKTGVLGIPASPLADDVRRVIGWGGAWRAYLDRVMPVLKIGREESLGDLVEKRMGRRVLERLVEPVASGVYSAAAADLEVDVVAPGLNAALTTTGSLSGAVLALRSAAPAGSAVGGLRGGMSSLVTALVADLQHFGAEIVTNQTVTQLARAGTDEKPSWTVTTGASAPPEKAHSDEAPVPGAVPGTGADAVADAATAPTTATTLYSRFVIVATPGASALELLAPLGEDFAALTELDWPHPAAVELATLVIDAPALDAQPRGTGVLVAAGTPGVSAKALTHVSAKWDWVAEAAGPGRHVVRLSYGRFNEANPADALSDAEFQALAVRDASIILGVDLDPAAVRGFARTPWRNALSPATLGARDRNRQVREVVEAVPGLEVTGAWLAGTGLASVIPDALTAAARTRHAALGL
ncbi:protoporphyrinogen oxidase [Leifsonia kafniensis]|uniref:Protoporphyrinogen oxidase n=1 Tax=Leifsonia kafniensis TaxID=475957 RepID=A0ABP7L1F1_9MICO